MPLIDRIFLRVLTVDFAIISYTILVLWVLLLGCGCVSLSVYLCVVLTSLLLFCWTFIGCWLVLLYCLLCYRRALLSWKQLININIIQHIWRLQLFESIISIHIEHLTWTKHSNPKLYNSSRPQQKSFHWGCIIEDDINWSGCHMPANHLVYYTWSKHEIQAILLKFRCYCCLTTNCKGEYLFFPPLVNITLYVSLA